MTAAFADAHLGLGFGDAGGVNPLTLGAQNPVTDRWYDLLPEMYRSVDEADTSTENGWPLYGFMDAMASVLVTPTTIAERIANGHLTDPALADDAWIPWLAQVVGTYGVGVAAQRTELANLAGAPALGSRKYLEVLTQQYLTGTKSVEVHAGESWAIVVRVRADELTLPGITTVEGLAAALYATGRVPSGFVLQVITEQETWAQLATAMPTWAPGEGKTWARISSMGLAGAGIAAGGVTWTSTAVGDAP